MDTLEFRALNSDLLLMAEGVSEQIALGFHSARNFIEACEQRFTRFSEQSELSRLNRAQGEWFSASPALFELIRLAKLYFDRTAGIFDPAILPDLKRAGYNRSMDVIRAGGSFPQIPDGRDFSFHSPTAESAGNNNTLIF